MQQKLIEAIKFVAKDGGMLDYDFKKLLTILETPEEESPYHPSLAAKAKDTSIEDMLNDPKPSMDWEEELKRVLPLGKETGDYELTYVNGRYIRYTIKDYNDVYQILNKFIQSQITKAREEEREKVIDEVWELIYKCFPSDMENLSTMTHNQAYRLLNTFTKEIKHLLTHKGNKI